MHIAYEVTPTACPLISCEHCFQCNPYCAMCSLYIATGVPDANVKPSTSGYRAHLSLVSDQTLCPLLLPAGACSLVNSPASRSTAHAYAEATRAQHNSSVLLPRAGAVEHLHASRCTAELDRVVRWRRRLSSCTSGTPFAALKRRPWT